MSDFLAEKRAELDARLKELRPLHDEYLMLERAKAALDAVERVGDGAAVPRRGPGRPRGSGGGGPRPAGSANGRRGGRGRRGEGRAAEALEIVRQNPGISVGEIADRLGMRQKNYLYRIMANLQSEGAVRKQGRGFSAG